MKVSLHEIDIKLFINQGVETKISSIKKSCKK